MFYIFKFIWEENLRLIDWFSSGNEYFYDGSFIMEGAFTMGIEGAGMNVGRFFICRDGKFVIITFSTACFCHKVLWWDMTEKRSFLEFMMYALLKVILIYHVPLAWISLTLSCHSSLLSIALGRSSMLHPVSVQSCLYLFFCWEASGDTNDKIYIFCPLGGA